MFAGHDGGRKPAILDRAGFKANYMQYIYFVLVEDGIGTRNIHIYKCSHL